MDPGGERCFSVVGVHELELCEGAFYVGLLIYPDVLVSVISGDLDPKV